MRKLLMLATLLVSGVAASNAQTSQTANISVTVSDIKTITINSGAAPGFAINSAANFTAVSGATGLAASTATNITVVSRGAYKVKAVLSGDLTNATATNGAGTIPGNKLGISVSGATTQSGETAPTVISANTVFTVGGGTIADIVKTSSTGNAGGTLGTTFNVNYKLANFPGVINLATGSFTANVVYTIEAN
ncbi:hypothetical protein F0919_17120 [Taibaiella lutea]|uniref:DUF4402 domain-containing protein n=1 Tax=Taibaiella lutea TaxID=2608001 RepID=A0A5M6CGD8_9BACT|nr:hypothetical protein [Taibaiella lutea]KAA5532505.1 hypothetical protein F0919_17120 [Taibaiella lutea]